MMKPFLPLLAVAILPLSALAQDAADYKARIEAATKEIMALRGGEREPFVAELIKQGRALVRDFPDKEDGYQILFAAAQQSPKDQADELLKELNNPKTPEAVRERVAGMLKMQEALGKPVEIKFTALDGREIDLTKMQGKVVLVDFWATWCGPCIQEMPTIKAAYEKLNSKGFEIVGISFDEDKESLQEFTKSRDIRWPQYFDGKGWENPYAIKYAITSIPNMWLIDKKGNLVDLQARENLEQKIEKLLAE